MPTTTTFETESLIAGKVITRNVKLAADTYYKGMPVEYDSGNGNYKYLAGGTLAGFFSEPDSRVVTANQYGTIIITGELQKGGIVDDSNDAYTVTEALITAWAGLGFYIRDDQAA